MTEQNSEMSLLVAFPDQSESFTLGFEAGVIWEQLEAGSPEIDRGMDEGMPIHTANIEVIQRMAAVKGYHLEIGEHTNEWTAIRLTVQSRPRPKLSVVG